MRVAGIGAEGEGRSEDDGPRARRGRHRRGVVADYREHAGVAAEIPAEVFPSNRLEGDRVLGGAEPSTVTAAEVQTVVDAVAVVVAAAPVSLATWFCPAVQASVSGASAETEIAPSNPQGASAWV